MKAENNNENVNLITKLRKRYNLSQIELAELLDVSKSSVSLWEKGNPIATEQLYSLSKIFNVTIDELIAGNLRSDLATEILKDDYDLDKYNLYEIINNDNVSDLKEYVRIFTNVKSLLFQKYLLYLNGKNMTPSEEEEIKFLSKSFVRLHLKPEDKNISQDEYQTLNDQQIFKRYYMNEDLSEDKLNFLLEKIFLYRGKFDIKDILRNKKQDVFMELIPLFPEILRSIIFTKYMEFHYCYTLDKRIITRFLENGAKILNLKESKIHDNLLNKKENILSNNYILKEIGNDQILNHKVDFIKMPDVKGDVFRINYMFAFQDISYSYFLKCVDEIKTKRIEKLMSVYGRNKEEYLEELYNLNI